MNEIQIAFNELLFGTAGGWVGFLFIASIMLVVTYKIKLSGIMFSVVSLFLSILVFENVSAASNINWLGIMYMIMPFFLLLIMYSGRSQI